ncbi:hypothetical protein PVAND_016039 [Polypedilum vanderplanki]|uniref:Protein YIPF n=1 Tax=Polypedilum vanderplanki TaxID=319348 RepID=A0A9J6BDZ2_POLVA|nr:hypothetical protein PVAND_016039 [Polypedilum vanderplanki]
MTDEQTKLDIFEDVDSSALAGSMTVSSKPSSTKAQPGASDFNSLDEPIKETFLRDVRAVGSKFKHVLYPKEKNTLLKSWDLWGPLVLCTFMATILQGNTENSRNNDGGPEFAEVFVIVWIGAMIVTLNTKLLGGQISFFQSVCVLGYCLMPLVLALIACTVILRLGNSYVFFIMRLAATTIGFIWATYATMNFMGDSQPKNRKALAVYPMFLFYFIISWLVVSHSNV